MGQLEAAVPKNILTSPRRSRKFTHNEAKEVSPIDGVEQRRANSGKETALRATLYLTPTFFTLVIITFRH